MFGVYDPIFRTNTRHTYMFETDLPARMVQPYVQYRGVSYYMFGHSMVHHRTSRAQKIETLTESQLTEFFPLKTYADWLSAGKEETQNVNKVGYKEHFESIEDLSNNANEPDIEVTKSGLANESSATRSDIEMNEVIEEQDITDMLPKYKIECTVVTTTAPSVEEPSQGGKKHFNSGICAICLDSLENEDSVRGLICGHVFHQVCLDPWLTTRRACCPICKRDLYIEVQNTSNNQTDGDSQGAANNETDNNPERNSSLAFNLNDMIRLPTGEPGAAEIDQIFNISPDNNFSFFLILIITRLEAQILLTALLYLRNNNYPQESSEQQADADSHNDQFRLNVEPNEHLNALFYSDQVNSRFYQKNDSDSFETPPIPDLNDLNPQIKRIVENHPPPFHPSDLVDLDYDAWNETKRMTRGIKRFYFYVIGISKLQLYYHNVLVKYEHNRRSRLNLEQT